MYSGGNVPCAAAAWDTRSDVVAASWDAEMRETVVVSDPVDGHNWAWAADDNLLDINSFALPVTFRRYGVYLSSGKDMQQSVYNLRCVRNCENTYIICTIQPL